MAKITLLGLYNYNNTLFDSEFDWPEDLDGSLCCQCILDRCGEFELLYPDWNFMHDLKIPLFFNKHYRTFQKWSDALNIEYDPLNNYDRTEEYTDEEHTSGSDSRSNTTTGTHSNTTGETHDTTRTTGGTSQNDVYAYDSASTASPKDKRTDSGTDRDAGGSTVTDSGTTGGTLSETGSNTGSKMLTHSAHLYGNIGVTTSQQMLQSELDIARWNLYEQIADLFCEEMCIMIY